MMEILPEKEIIELYSIVGDGKLEACQESCRQGLEECLSCCRGGVILLPGESILLKKAQEKGLVPSSIQIWPSLMDGCSDIQKVCPMGDYKPFVCRAYPQIRWQRISRFNNFLHLEPTSNEYCPASGKENAEFLERVTKASEYLRKCLEVEIGEEIFLSRRHS